MGLSQPAHLIVLFLIVLLLFGARRLPEMGRSLGLGMREFKDSVSGIGRNDATEEQPGTLVPVQTTATQGQDE
jgi:sec-independent protein translocase protein TatA